MPSAIEVRRVPIHSVADASELTKLIESGVMDASRVIAIIGKTEGNGGVNDYTRIIADRAFREALVAAGAPGDAVKEVPIVWSGGTDGVISPHATIFATTDAEPSDEPRLTVGFAMSEVLLPEDIGRVAMVTKVADAVKVAMERAGITDVADVHYVQTKTPLLSQQRSLGLHVMHVGDVGDPRPLHGDLHGVGHLRHHGDPADVLGQQHLAHREADGEPGLVAGLGIGGGEDRGVRADHAVGAARPTNRERAEPVGERTPRV